jgi:hypothetical protein
VNDEDGVLTPLLIGNDKHAYLNELTMLGLNRLAGW